MIVLMLFEEPWHDALFFATSGFVLGVLFSMTCVILYLMRGRRKDSVRDEYRPKRWKDDTPPGHFRTYERKVTYREPPKVTPR